MSLKELIRIFRKVIQQRRRKIALEYFASTDVRLHLLNDIDMILKDVMEKLE